MQASSILIGCTLGLLLIGGGRLHQATPINSSGHDSSSTYSQSTTADIITVAAPAISTHFNSLSSDNVAPKYLLFYISGATPEIPLGNPGTAYTKAQAEKAVDNLVATIRQVGDHVHTQLGFSVGPLAFDHTDSQLRALIADSFAVAEEKNVAVAFHIDDSMFWNARKDLWSDKNNIEWTDWTGKTQPHRIIGWVLGGKPVLAPQMCFNSPAIVAETTRIAGDVIGPAIKRGIDRLNAIGKSYLFAGVIAGWETRLQDDSNRSINDSELQYGFCALHNLGYSAQNPPKDMDLTLQQVVSDWIVLWAKNLIAGGVPRTAIYTHIGAPGTLPPFMPASKVLRFAYKDSSADVTAFNRYSNPGFTVHGMGSFSQLYKILAAHPPSPWGISEGTNVNLANSFSGGPAASGYTMEQYLGRAFNHGAVFVNLYGWNTTDTGDEFAKAASGPSAIAAYEKFLSGKNLVEVSTANGVSVAAPHLEPAIDLLSKIQRIQNNLPNWLSQHHNQQSTIQSLVPKLNGYMKAGNLAEAERIADEILGIIAERTPASSATSASLDNLSVKIKKIQNNLPDWFSQHPDRKSTIQSILPKLDGYAKAGNATAAEKAADEILSIMEQ
jgi:hypothetical protein